MPVSLDHALTPLAFSKGLAFEYLGDLPSINGCGERLNLVCHVEGIIEQTRERQGDLSRKVATSILNQSSPPSSRRPVRFVWNLRCGPFALLLHWLPAVSEGWL